MGPSRGWGWDVGDLPSHSYVVNLWKIYVGKFTMKKFHEISPSYD